MFDVTAFAARFVARFGRPPRLFSAPGRVNLIGEHTDYNDGFVLPMAIERRTFVAAAARPDRTIVARSETLGEEFAIDLDAAPSRRTGSFRDYVEGVARVLAADGFRIPGADLLIASEVPPGAGLSASAALELSVGMALAALGGTAEPDRVKLALAGQRAEHEYVGTLCGIMDQYVSSLGEEDHALLVDCRSLEQKLVPLALGDARIVVLDTGVKHELASSEYNQRRRECEEGVAALAPVLPGVRALRDVAYDDLVRHRARLSDVVFRRCRHVVTENARTLEATAALGRGDLARFGALMAESHRSLRDDYEVSARELDVAVEAALSVPGVHGSRMTGGGFGGCTVTLVDGVAVGALRTHLIARFQGEFATTPDLFATKACGGVREERTISK